ncbi:MAG: methyltransferase domain-containing protein [Nitrospinae bacterium]|nr:methyltransferase domain-containing protein [Nitrospinota bacterium]
MSAGCCDDSDQIKSAVRELYAKVAAGEVSCCGDSDAEMPMGADNVQSIGYAKDAVEELPRDVLSANAGCGNPIADAHPKPGETVLDLGSGAGLDCFLAAKEVGPRGSVVGLDMTDAMLEKAEKNRQRLGAQNVSFRKGEMEDMPSSSATASSISRRTRRPYTVNLSACCVRADASWCRTSSGRENQRKTKPPSHPQKPPSRIGARASRAQSASMHILPGCARPDSPTWKS